MKAFLAWSGGKDSALALYKANQQGLPIAALVTVVNKATNRISMHGVRRALLHRQAASLRLPLYSIELPEQPGMGEYEMAVSNTSCLLKSNGFTHAVSGDLFLEDLKVYREELYARDQLKCLFPLWKTDTEEMMKTFIAAGFKAIIVCVNKAMLDKSFCGRMLDESFIKDLPENVDVCGENGEYHSFVFDGPIFSSPIHFVKGEIVFKEYASPQTKKEGSITLAPQSTGFYFCDLLPADILHEDLTLLK